MKGIQNRDWNQTTMKGITTETGIRLQRRGLQQRLESDYNEGAEIDVSLEPENKRMK
jgi:hypothetical protein